MYVVYSQNPLSRLFLRPTVALLWDVAVSWVDLAAQPPGLTHSPSNAALPSHDGVHARLVAAASLPDCVAVCIVAAGLSMRHVWIQKKGPKPFLFPNNQASRPYCYYLTPFRVFISCNLKLT